MVSFYILYSNKEFNNYDGDLLILPQVVAESNEANHPQDVNKLESSNRQQVVDKLENEIFPQLGGKFKISPFNIPWGHNKAIIDRCNKNIDKTLFFIDQVIKNEWSRDVLLNFLETD